MNEIPQPPVKSGIYKSANGETHYYTKERRFVLRTVEDDVGTIPVWCLDISQYDVVLTPEAKPTVLQQLGDIIKSGSTLFVTRAEMAVGQELFAATITKSPDSIESFIGRDVELEAAIQFAIKNHIAHLTQEREKLQRRLAELNHLIK